MKANELMIGDHVSHFDDGINCVVIELSERKVAVSYTAVNGDKKYGELLPEMAFEPILLTAEILEKNGFHESILRDDRWIYQDIAFTKVNDYYILSSLYDDFMIGIRPHICAVHELQHALRLCGINKEIEL